MKRPSHITIISLLLIFFGLIGINSGLADIYYSEFMNIFINTLSQNPDSLSQLSSNLMKQDLLAYPAWFNSWLPVQGLITMLVYGVYFLSGLFLFISKPYSIKFFFIAVGTSILWEIIQSIILHQTNHPSIGFDAGALVISIFIDVTFMMIIKFNHKVELGK